jgi:hypothetical protein
MKMRFLKLKSDKPTHGGQKSVQYDNGPKQNNILDAALPGLKKYCTDKQWIPQKSSTICDSYYMQGNKTTGFVK